jgi:hypothetical protein
MMLSHYRAVLGANRYGASCSVRLAKILLSEGKEANCAVRSPPMISQAHASNPNYEAQNAWGHSDMVG